MDEKFILSPRFKYIASIAVFIGVVTASFGFYFNSGVTWANLLLNNYYFLSLVIGASFFYAIQYISQSGWSAQFIRIPLAISSYLFIGAFLILILYFGMESLYHWSIPDAGINDLIIAHKKPYLNVPFFFIRIILFLGLWIFMIWLLFKTSLKEDEKGGIKFFNRSELLSKIYIFILAISFSLLTFDMIMSIDVHWFSTIFSVMNFVSGFYHAVAIIILILILLNHKGYYKNLHKGHLQNFSKYLFILGLIWIYLWFMQFLVIWFTNIQEETIYYVVRTSGDWQVFFYLNIILNWAIPFLLLLIGNASHKKSLLLFICILLIIGQWVDLYLQIMPGTIGEVHIGFIEIGIFVGFAGIFYLAVTRTLSLFPLLPQNHPYMKESMHNDLD